MQYVNGSFIFLPGKISMIFGMLQGAFWNTKKTQMPSHVKVIDVTK